MTKGERLATKIRKEVENMINEKNLSTQVGGASS
jgi:hypothetical protein